MGCCVFAMASIRKEKIGRVTTSAPANWRFQTLLYNIAHSHLSLTIYLKNHWVFSTRSRLVKILRINLPTDLKCVLHRLSNNFTLNKHWIAILSFGVHFTLSRYIDSITEFLLPILSQFIFCTLFCNRLIFSVLSMTLAGNPFSRFPKNVLGIPCGWFGTHNTGECKNCSIQAMRWWPLICCYSSMKERRDV